MREGADGAARRGAAIGATHYTVARLLTPILSATHRSALLLNMPPPMFSMVEGVCELSEDRTTMSKARPDPHAALAMTDVLPLGAETHLLVQQSKFMDGDSIFIGAMSDDGRAVAIHIFDGHLHKLPDVRLRPSLKLNKAGSLRGADNTLVSVRLGRAHADGGVACRLSFRVFGHGAWTLAQDVLKGDVRVFAKCNLDGDCVSLVE